MTYIIIHYSKSWNLFTKWLRKSYTSPYKTAILDWDFEHIYRAHHLFCLIMTLKMKSHKMGVYLKFWIFSQQLLFGGGAKLYDYTFLKSIVKGDWVLY